MAGKMSPSGHLGHSVHPLTPLLLPHLKGHNKAIDYYSVPGTDRRYAWSEATKPSLSGSETDVSATSSTTSISENLTPEERNLLRVGIRQEPQGEERLNPAYDFVGDNHSNNTLIIHKGIDQMSPNGYSFYGTPSGPHGLQGKPMTVNHSVNQGQYMNISQSPSPVYCQMRPQMSPQPASPGLGVNMSKFSRNNYQLDQLLANGGPPVDHTQPMLNSYLQSALATQWRFGAKRGQQNDCSPGPGNHVIPPPNYESRGMDSPNGSGGSGSGSILTTPESKSNERLSCLSRSHPDLSKLDEELPPVFRNQYYVNHHYSPEGLPPTPRPNEVDLMRAENNALKTELEIFYRRVSKLQKFELEIQKVHHAHEDLMRSSEKKEKLERAVRYKLEIELRRFQEQNKDLKEQINAALDTITASKKNPDGSSTGEDNEIQKRDLLIAQLLTQNKELLADKERQEFELQAQRLTLEEQRNHIEILDNALMSAQNNVVKLEAELRKKQTYEERANHLQKALANLQLASDRRLQMEKRVRTHLEKEIENLKKHLNGGKGKEVGEPSEVDGLKKMVREYEEKIIQLETEVTKWEQKYLEESALRHIEVNAASAPKDAKIAALERTSHECEKMIAEARTERLKHMDELHLAHKRAAELGAKIKDFESKLAEKDAMIKVLQQHSMEKDVVFQKSIFAARAAPGRHGRSASSIGLTTGTAPGKLNCLELESRRPKTPPPTISEGKGCPSPGPANSGCQEGGCPASSAAAVALAKKTNFDEQLKELDARLTSKDSIIRALRSEKERYPNHFWRI